MAGPLHHRHHDQTPPIGEVPVPHGPEESDSPARPDTEYATDYEKQIFSHLIQPDDLYTPDGVYWADLPFFQRAKFVSKVDRAESKRERAIIWSMFKKDPLSPVAWYFRNAVLPGAGLLLEGYVLFSIGNLSGLFADVWPRCWGKETPKKCDSNWVAAVTYLEIIGIMFGQTGVGVSSRASSDLIRYTQQRLTTTLFRRLLVIGSDDDGALSKMRPSCFSVFCCSRLLGASPCRTGSSSMPSLYSSTVRHIAQHSVSPYFRDLLADVSQASVSAANTLSQQRPPWKMPSELAKFQPKMTAFIVDARSPWPSSCRAGASSSTKSS